MKVQDLRNLLGPVVKRIADIAVAEMGLTEARVIAEKADIQELGDNEKIYFELPESAIFSRLALNAVGREAKVRSVRAMRNEKDAVEKLVLTVKLCEALDQMSWLFLASWAETEEQFVSIVSANGGYGIRVDEEGKVFLVHVTEKTDPIVKLIRGALE